MYFHKKFPSVCEQILNSFFVMFFHFNHQAGFFLFRDFFLRSDVDAPSPPLSFSFSLTPPLLVFLRFFSPPSIIPFSPFLFLLSSFSFPLPLPPPLFFSTSSSYLSPLPSPSPLFPPCSPLPPPLPPAATDICRLAVRVTPWQADDVQ